MNKCITISYGRVRGTAKNYTYHQPCIYEEYITKDGRKVWKLHSVVGIARRSFRLAKEDAKKIAYEEKIPYLSGIRQWRSISN